jgi:hypothetical protein
VLKHFAAGFFAVAAFLGAAGHPVVVSMLLARFRTRLARFGAGLADDCGERSTARDDSGRRSADFGAVLAGPKRPQMPFVPLGEQSAAIGGAAIAFPLTIVARLGAFHQRFAIAVRAISFRSGWSATTSFPVPLTSLPAFTLLTLLSRSGLPDHRSRQTG